MAGQDDLDVARVHEEDYQLRAEPYPDDLVELEGLPVYTAEHGCNRKKRDARSTVWKLRDATWTRGRMQVAKAGWLFNREGDICIAETAGAIVVTRKWISKVETVLRAAAIPCDSFSPVEQQRERI